MAPGWPALEQPRAELAFLGPGQLHHVAGIVGRPLDEGQGLQHRVVHVGGHLGPLLGQGPGLTLRHQVTDQREPPGAEDHHDGGDDQQCTPDRSEGGPGGVAEDEDQEPSDADDHPDADPEDQ